MKRAVLLIVKFIVLHIVFLCIASATFYFYLQTTRIVAGEPMSFLPITSIFPMLPFILSCVSITVGFFVQGSCVRTAARIPAQITSALLVAAVWLAVIPACAVLRDGVFSAESVMQPKKSVSAGFFRPYKDGIFFATDGGETTDGIFFQRTDVRLPSVIENLSASELQIPPYSDVLVANTVYTPSFLVRLADEAAFFTRVGTAAHGQGFFAWISFASICLPFAAISSLTRAGSWKLKNVVVMMFVFAGVVVFNRLYYRFDVFQEVAITPSALPSNAELDIPHVVFNLILAVIILLSGILGTVLTAQKKSRFDE
jgi:hypothetical protein